MALPNTSSYRQQNYTQHSCLTSFLINAILLNSKTSVISTWFEEEIGIFQDTSELDLHLKMSTQHSQIC